MAGEAALEEGRAVPALVVRNTRADAHRCCEKLRRALVLAAAERAELHSLGETLWRGPAAGQGSRVAGALAHTRAALSAGCLRCGDIIGRWATNNANGAGANGAGGRSCVARASTLHAASPPPANVATASREVEHGSTGLEGRPTVVATSDVGRIHASRCCSPCWALCAPTAPAELG